MLGRALNLAAASLVGCLVATAGQAQNLDAGKSPAQIFNSNCAACHKSARGLLKTVSPSSLSGFLRQHYTTGSDMAQMLSGYLMANGATAADSRPGGSKRGRSEAGTNLRPDAPIGSAAAPDGDRAREPAQRPDSVLFGRRQSRPQSPDVAVQPDGTPVAGAPGEPSGTKAKQKLAKKNRKGEPPKTETKTEPAPTEAAPDVAAKPETAPETAAAKEVAKERAIDAAVPVPEPVDLPPPTAADIKPAAAELPKAPTEKTSAERAPADKHPADKAATEKADTEKAGSEKVSSEKATADPPKPPPPASPPAQGAPPSASASAVGGPPTPPISQ